jgi:hypothetical protein
MREFVSAVIGFSRPFKLFVPANLLSREHQSPKLEMGHLEL